MEYQIPQIKVIQLKHGNPILAGSTLNGNAGSDHRGSFGGGASSKRSIIYYDDESSDNQCEYDSCWKGKIY